MYEVHCFLYGIRLLLYGIFVLAKSKYILINANKMHTILFKGKATITYEINNRPTENILHGILGGPVYYKYHLRTTHLPHT